MAQSDAYADIEEDGTRAVGVYSPLLGGIATPVVIPSLPRETTPAIQHLNPAVEIGDRSFVLMTREPAAIPSPRPPHRRDDITRARDTRFIGF